MYTVGHKNGATFIFTITLANVDRFQQNSGAVEDLSYRILQFIYESERIIEIGPHLPKLS